MFQLHPRLAADTLPIAKLELCEARLMNDSRFPWVILIPMRDALTELHQLSPAEQQQLMAESTAVAEALIAMDEVTKINLGALGNLVPQFHWHVVGRNPEDTCWPGPVWGCGSTIPYSAKKQAALIAELRQAIGA